jgi:hypothetical protein
MHFFVFGLQHLYYIGYAVRAGKLDEKREHICLKTVIPHSTMTSCSLLDKSGSSMGAIFSMGTYQNRTWIFVYTTMLTKSV